MAWPPKAGVKSTNSASTVGQVTIKTDPLMTVAVGSVATGRIDQADSSKAGRNVDAPVPRHSIYQSRTGCSTNGSLNMSKAPSARGLKIAMGRQRAYHRWNLESLPKNLLSIAPLALLAQTPMIWGAAIMARRSVGKNRLGKKKNRRVFAAGYGEGS